MITNIFSSKNKKQVKYSVLIFLMMLSTIFTSKANPPSAPSITDYSPASGTVGTLVTITGTNLTSTTAISISGISAILISNTDSTVVGMVMPGTSTGNIYITTAGGSVTSTNSFVVINNLIPNIQQEELNANDNFTPSNEGSAVSLSADGNTAIVGGRGDSLNYGASWIYTRDNNGVWLQQGTRLTASDGGSNPNKGYSVSMSADGNTAIVGGPYDFDFYNNNLLDIGAAWIYTRINNKWSQQGPKLQPVDAWSGNVYFGRSVSISADGNTAIVGGEEDSSGIGAAWVFTRNNGIWTQQGKKLVANVKSYYQGYAVGLSADGNTAIVGAPGDSVGAVFIYTRTKGIWSQQSGKLIGAGSTSNNPPFYVGQGTSVSLSADGNTAIVGSNSAGYNVGDVWVFTRNNTVWSQLCNKLVVAGFIATTNQNYLQQNAAVALSADGNTAIVGGYNDNNLIGAAWIFKRTNNSWSQSRKLVGNGSVGYSSQGWSVGISADGNTAISGGPWDNQDGAAWVFSSSSLAPVTLLSFTAEKQNNHVILNWQTANEINNNHFIIQYSKDGKNYTNAGIVNGKNQTENEYCFIHNTPVAGINYYRLQQVDKDGSSTLSSVRTVVLNNISKGEISIYPNPVKNKSFTIDMGKDISTGIPYKIYSESGTLLQQGMINNRIQTINLTTSIKGNNVLKLPDVQTVDLIKL